MIPEELKTVIEIMCGRKPGAAANAVREDYPEIAEILDGAFDRLEAELREALEHNKKAMAEYGSQLVHEDCRKFLVDAGARETQTLWGQVKDMCARVKMLTDERDQQARRIGELESALKWRPISEIHEDYGPCVLIHIDDVGYQEIGSNLNIDFDASRWTHFAQIPPLGQEQYERMKAEHEAQDALNLDGKG